MQIEHYFTTASDGNIAFHVTNDHYSVENNRSKLALKYGYNAHKLYFMDQTHKDNIVIIDEKSPTLTQDCDALITQLPDTTLMVMVADCIPILLKDEKKGVIAAIHAGRNSTFLQIAPKTVQKMIKHFACNPKDIEAIMGPSIQKCCYEVSIELANIVQTSFGEQFEKNRYIDLQGINKKLLQEVGVENIIISPICTHCSKEDYFSYRLDKNCGRFAGLIHKSQ